MRNLALAFVAASTIMLSGATTAAPITSIPSVAADNQSLITQVRHRGGWGHRGWHRGGWGHRGWRGGWHRRGWHGRRWYGPRWRRGWYGPGWGFYGGGVIVGSCVAVRRSCAWRWGWGGPNFRRCVWRRGC
jgi:hypothetical protein